MPRFYDNNYILQVPCALQGTVKITNKDDIQSPLSSSSVRRTDSEAPQYELKMQYGSTTITFLTQPGVIIDPKTMFCKIISNQGIDYFIQTPMFALAGLLINRHITEERIKVAKDTERYALSISLTRLQGQIDSLSTYSIISASVITAVYAINKGTGQVAVENTELIKVFSDISFQTHSCPFSPFIANISELDEQYRTAIQTSLNNDSSYNERQSKMQRLIWLPDEISFTTDSQFPLQMLNYRKSLEYCFPQTLVFDVWPAQIELSKVDGMDSYIKGRLYNIAKDNRDVTVPSDTSSLFDSMVQFARKMNHPHLAAFLSMAILDIEDHDNRFLEKMSLIEDVLSADVLTDRHLDSRIANLDDVNRNKSSLYREVKAFYVFMLAVLCDNADISFRANGGVNMKIKVYDSSLLAYWLNGVIKLRYRS